jgi:DNA-directed RNA polymerase specialized sigma24 family protein
MRREPDITILRNVLCQLGYEQRLAIYLRFWSQYTINEIANFIGKSWDYTDRLIERTLTDLLSEIAKNNKVKEQLRAA